MKNNIKTIICAFALLFSASLTTMAEDKDSKKSTGFGTGIYATKSGKINVLVDKYQSEAPTKILLKNDRGEIFYREVIKKDNTKFGRVLNIDNLEAGQYHIEITSNGERQIQDFKVSTPVITRKVELNR
tara:strand:- start:847 stop:1233 length:387 start_codon:yes stop_codon:yes gene_type:complete